MIRYFLRALRAQLAGGLSLYLLSLFGVAIGVASVLSIQILNLNALGAFKGSVEAVSGDADFTVVGNSATLDETLYPRLLGAEGVAAAYPLYRVNVALTEDPNFFLEILGMDLFAPIELPWGDEEEQSDGVVFDATEALTGENWVAISNRLGRELDVRPGESIEVSLGSSRIALRVGAWIDFQRVSPMASPRMVVMDISAAQGLFGGSGVLSQVDVRLRDGVSFGASRSALEAVVGERGEVLTPQQREQQAADLLSAFRLNLTALSLISLLVGGFLVYSSTQASLVRRRNEFGLLRSLGATREQVLALLTGEVALLAILGVAIGMPLGYWAAELNVERVSATLSNLYLLEEIHNLEIPLWFYALAVGVGLLGAALGGLFPALELSRKDTRALLAAFTLHERVGRAAPKLFFGGCVILTAVLALVVGTKDRWPPAGFIEAFGLMLAVPLLTPLAVQRFTARIPVHRLGLSYGMKGLGKQLQTTPVAIAALAIAVSMLVGITTMVSSFRETLTIWIDSTVQADIYVSTPSWRRARREAVLDPSVIESMRAHPSVRQLDRLRQIFVRAGGRRLPLAGIDASVPLREGRFTLVSGDVEQAMDGMRSGGVMVGEPLARKLRLAPGDTLSVRGPDGPAELSIVAVYYDYSSELGSAFMSLGALEDKFGPGPIHNVALYLEPNADAEKVVDDLKERFIDLPLEIRSNRRLKEEVFRIFDQTFAITRLLQAMGLMIAVCGITLTLLVLARERVAELALYRALGADRRQIFEVFLGKGIGMALAGLVLGGLAGCGFAYLLIFVINRAYFGWTIAVFWPIGMLVGQAGIILLAAAAASVYPALVASRTPATELRRENV